MVSIVDCGSIDPCSIHGSPKLFFPFITEITKMEKTIPTPVIPPPIVVNDKAKIPNTKKDIRCSRFEEIKSLNPDIRSEYFFEKYKKEYESLSKRDGPVRVCPDFKLKTKAIEILKVTREQYNSIKVNLPRIRFEKSSIHLWGVFSATRIAENEPIVEYTGELIRTSITEERQHSNEQEGNNGSYIFKLNDDLYIDATQKGGIARFLNHSCDPNCKTRIIEVETPNGGERHVVICAKRNILPYEELTYNYRLPYETKDKAIPCLCGSDNCKGYLNYSEEYQAEMLDGNGSEEENLENEE